MCVGNPRALVKGEVNEFNAIAPNFFTVGFAMAQNSAADRSSLTWSI